MTERGLTGGSKKKMSRVSFVLGRVSHNPIDPEHISCERHFGWQSDS
jgi:hypothetical protein